MKFVAPGVHEQKIIYSMSLLLVYKSIIPLHPQLNYQLIEADDASMVHQTRPLSVAHHNMFFI